MTWKTLEKFGDMTLIEDLERRVSALETAQKETAKTQTWMASTLGRIASVQDQHTAAIAELQADMHDVKGDLRGVKIDLRGVKADLEGVKADLRGVAADLKGLRADLPEMLSEAVREGLKQR